MNDYVKSLLKGNMFSLTVKCCVSKLSCCVFMLYCVSSLYLLIFDTSFIADIRLFENKLIAMTVCAVTVIIGFLLLLNALWQRYRYKTGVFSVCERVEIQEFSFSSAIKYLSLRAAVNLLKGILYPPSDCLFWI